MYCYFQPKSLVQVVMGVVYQYSSITTTKYPTIAQNNYVPLPDDLVVHVLSPRLYQVV